MPCPENKPPERNGANEPMRRHKWACALTTIAVPERRDTLLPRTLTSLEAGGFPRPRLCIDGENNCQWWERNYPDYELTFRYPKIRTHGNWILGLYELYIRNPTVDRYAMFQDDLVCYRNLREYLDRVPYPDKGYCNLYTIPRNENVFPAIGQTGRKRFGWFPSRQNGWGAVALVFSREAVLKLLAAEHMVSRPLDVQRGYKAVDGGIVDSMKKAGWREYIHNPSLVQHTGERSSLKKSIPDWYLRSGNFLGENFDALELLQHDNFVAK